MRIVAAFASVMALFEKGKTVSWSEVANNTEAGAAAIYGLFSTVIAVLKLFGVDTNVDGLDLHDVANGSTALLSMGYGFYRAATNPQVGVKK
jgi:hypothetical protein